MATATYEAIASITLGSSASSVTFSSIPQDYRDLVLVYDAGTTFSGNNAVRFNGTTLNSDSSAIYSRVAMYGNGSSANSEADSDPEEALIFGGNGYKALGSLQIMDYSATDKHKTILERASVGVTGAFPSYAQASRYGSTNAITSIELDPAAESFTAGSTFALYGIEA